MMCSFYLQIFRAVVRLLPSTSVDTFVVDFEAGIYDRLTGRFRRPHNQGMCISFWASTVQDVQELGLQVTHIAYSV